MRAITSPLFSRLVSPSPPSPSPCSNPSLPLCALLSTSYLFWNSPTLSVVYRKLLEHFFFLFVSKFWLKITTLKNNPWVTVTGVSYFPLPSPSPSSPLPFLVSLVGDSSRGFSQSESANLRMNHNCQHSIEGVGSLGALRASPFNHPSSQSAHE